MVIRLLCKNSLKFSTFRSFSSCSQLKIPPSINLAGENYPTDSTYNLNSRVLSCVGKNLHRKEQHPLFLVKRNIENFFIRHFVTNYGSPIFSFIDNIPPVVSTAQNFDSLLIPPEHPSRKPQDTYYINKDTILRSHTSAHQVDLIKSGLNAFLCFGDTYRRDAVDRTHYPVFHQLEGVRLFTPHALAEIHRNNKAAMSSHLFVPKDRGLGRDTYRQELHSSEAASVIEADLKSCVEKLFVHLFGSDIKFRWNEEYFPFTHPSWELEIFWQGYWLEVLGCGVIEQQVLCNGSVGNYLGWAFGIGLERIAMALYEIPDIRIFWSEDERFLKQFDKASPGTRVVYKTVSTQPPVFNDVSFWVADSFTENDFFDVVRSIGGDLIEDVKLLDEFKKGDRISHCYRLTYRSPMRALTQAEVSEIHEQIKAVAQDQLKVELRV